MRRRFLNRGGERYADTPDLISLVEQALGDEDPYAQPELARALDQFDREMDAILRPASIMYLYRISNTADDFLAAGDREGFADFIENYWRPQTEWWQLAKRHGPLIAAQLPAEQAARFSKSANEILYHDVYAPARIDILLQDALSREDLSDSQRQQLLHIAGTLESQRERRRREAVELTERIRSPAAVRRRAEQFAASRFDRSLPVQTEEYLEYLEIIETYRTIGSELEAEVVRTLEEGDGV